MAELLAGVALVIALIAITAVLSLARELADLRASHAGAQFASAPTQSAASVSAFELEAVDGKVRLLPGSDALLVALLPGCSACDGLLSTAPMQWLREVPMAVVVAGDRDYANTVSSRYGFDRKNVLVDPDGRFLRTIGVSAFPSVVVVTGGTVAGVVPASDWDAVKQAAAGIRTGQVSLARQMAEARADGLTA